MRFYFILFLIILVFLVVVSLGCNGSPATPNAGPNKVKTNGNDVPKPENTVPHYTYEIVNTYQHDPKAFTQGLVFKDGFLFESTGEYGRSTLRKVELETGQVTKKVDLDKKFFAEGMTILGGKIYQLTWRENVCFVYNESDFSPLKEFRYQGEGWGLTNDGKNLIMSDGTHLIKFIDPETFQTMRTLAIFQENGNPLYLINELEYINGEIWANIWHSEEKETQTTQGILPNIGKPNYIARINPQTGKVTGWIDLANISPEDSAGGENTLNGIAYDSGSDRLFVTGKEWKKLFEIKLKAK
ncbi:MAG: glutaminyl-peptide cyclotransferase [Pyrinomonadaceae bacterium]